MCVSPFIPPSLATDTGGGGRVGGGEGSATPTDGTNPPAGTGGTTAGPSKGGGATGGANGTALTDDSAGASNGAGGCSIGGNGAGSRVSAGLSMLALLGLAVAVRRRRR